MTTSNVWTNYDPVELPEITKNFDNNLLNLDQKFHILRELKRAAKIPKGRAKFNQNFHNKYQHKSQIKPPFHPEERTNIVQEDCLENQLKDAVSNFKRKPKVQIKNPEEIHKTGKPKQDLEEIPITDEVPKKLKKKKHNRESCSELEVAEIPALNADKILKKKKKKQKHDQENNIKNNLKEIPENNGVEIPKKKKKQKKVLEKGSEDKELLTNKTDKSSKKKEQIEQDSSLPTNSEDETPKRKKKKNEKVSVVDVDADLGDKFKELSHKNSKKRKSKLDREQSLEEDLKEILTNTGNELPKRKKNKKSKKNGELELESHEEIPINIEDENPKRKKLKKQKESLLEDKLKEVSTELPNENKNHKKLKKKQQIEEESSLEVPTNIDEVISKKKKHKKNKEATVDKKLKEATSNEKPKTQTNNAVKNSIKKIKKQVNCKSIFLSFFGDKKL